MTQALDLSRTVGELVVERPARARIFEKLGIDYCCGGNKPLDEACRAMGIDHTRVHAELEEADTQADGDRDRLDPNGMSLAALADHIVETHHAYLRRELPRLGALTKRVHHAHGTRDERLGEVERIFGALAEELFSHMLKEERILFPIVRRIEASAGPAESHCGSISNPIAVMEQEHQIAGDALATLREKTDGFEPPSWACNTYRVMLDGLAELERDLHLHIHKEDNILFPKALALEGPR